jgi:hypothetical protein
VGACAGASRAWRAQTPGVTLAYEDRFMEVRAPSLSFPLPETPPLPSAPVLWCPAVASMSTARAMARGVRPSGVCRRCGGVEGYHYTGGQVCACLSVCVWRVARLFGDGARVAWSWQGTAHVVPVPSSPTRGCSVRGVSTTCVFGVDRGHWAAGILPRMSTGAVPLRACMWVCVHRWSSACSSRRCA